MDTSTIGIILIYVVIIAAFYFIAIRPNKKKEKEHQALMSSVAVGDSILTTSGFYGVVIDIEEDTVIVEFGSNRNCRIPMQKSAIAAVEKLSKDVHLMPDEINQRIAELKLASLGVKIDEEKNAVRSDQVREISTPDSKIRVLVVPTNEEYMIARDTYDIVATLL